MSKKMAMTKEQIRKLTDIYYKADKLNLAKMSDMDRLMRELTSDRDKNLIKIAQESSDINDRESLSTLKRLKLLEQDISEIKELLKFGSIEELLDICQEEDEDEDGVV